MTMFAVQGSVYGHQQQKGAVAARNRAKLANFNAANEAYVAETILNNSAWKDKVQQSEGRIDDIFNDAADQWMQQDLQMEEVYAKHAFNVVDILTERYKNEYAGEQTGVTATRIAGANVREAGMALTKSVRNVIMNEEKAQLNKEIVANEANQKRMQEWEQVRQSPVPGFTPPPPEYEAGPGIGGLLMQVAMNAASSYMMGTKINKMDKLLEQGIPKGGGGMPWNMTESAFGGDMAGLGNFSMDSKVWNATGSQGWFSSGNLLGAEAFSGGSALGMPMPGMDVLGSKLAVPF